MYSKSVKTVSSQNIKTVLKDRVSKKSILNTDTFPPYEIVGQDYAGHRVVDHKAGQYVDGPAYTNNAEGYFSQLKRSLSGAFHHVSDKHLDRYLAEFDYRYNTRKIKDGNRMVESIKRSEGKRLQYADLIAKD